MHGGLICLPPLTSPSSVCSHQGLTCAETTVCTSRSDLHLVPSPDRDPWPSWLPSWGSDRRKCPAWGLEWVWALRPGTLGAWTGRAGCGWGAVGQSRPLQPGDSLRAYKWVTFLNVGPLPPPSPSSPELPEATGAHPTPASVSSAPPLLPSAQAGPSQRPPPPPRSAQLCSARSLVDGS